MSVSSAALLGIAALPSLEDEEGDDVPVRAAPQMLAGLVYVYIDIYIYICMLSACLHVN